MLNNPLEVYDALKYGLDMPRRGYWEEKRTEDAHRDVVTATQMHS